MATGPRLSDFVLLACHLHIESPQSDEEEERESREPPALEEQPAEGADLRESPESGGSSVSESEETVRYRVDIDEVAMRYTVTHEEGSLIAVIWTELADPTEPLHFEVVTGARFVPPEPPVPLDAIASTLLFIAFPYVREVVMNLTARTPFGTYLLPPLTKLPHPHVERE